MGLFDRKAVQHERRRDSGEWERWRGEIDATIKSNANINADHIEKEEKRWDKFEERLEDIVGIAQECPESTHIKTQNSKIDKQTDKIELLDTSIGKVAVEVGNTKGTVRVWCYIFAALIIASGIGSFIGAIIMSK